jgi:hypothetical protein
MSFHQRCELSKILYYIKVYSIMFCIMACRALYRVLCWGILVPLMTVSTVCGWSREMARPRAFRYFFSWRRLDSSCCLHVTYDTAVLSEPKYHGGFLYGKQNFVEHRPLVTQCLGPFSSLFEIGVGLLTQPV